MKAEIKHLELLTKKYGKDFELTYSEKGVHMKAGAMYTGTCLQECIDMAIFREGEQHLNSLEDDFDYKHVLIKYLQHIESIEGSFYTNESEHLKGNALKALINIVNENKL